MADAGKPNPWRYAHMGMEFGIATAVCAGVGYYLDGKWGTRPWAALTGASVGFAGGMYLFIKDALKANRQSAAAMRSQKLDTRHPKHEHERGRESDP